jgi:serine/threonine protein kinase
MFECALGMQYLHGVSKLSGQLLFYDPDLPGYQRGLVHGSLRPTNVLIADNGQACIADYGMIELKPSTGVSARYFSPEAWKGVCPSD